MTRLTFGCLCMVALLAMPAARAADDGHSARVKALEHAAFEDPDNPTLQGALAQAYYEIFSASEDPIYEELSIAQYEKFLSLQPRHEGANLALYSLKYGRLLKSPRPELLREIKQIYERIPQSTRTAMMPLSTVEAVALMVAAEKSGSSKTGREQIRSLLQSGIRENPRYSRSYFLLARNYNLHKEYDLEIAVLRQAAFMFPDNPEVAKKLAEALDNKLLGMECYVADPSLLEDTMQAWQKALVGAPEDARIHQQLSLKYGLMGLYELQLFEARTLYKLTNSASDRLLLADALVNNGYPREAVEMYEEMSKKSSALSSLKKNMGTAYFLQQELDKAAKHLSAYVRENPDKFYARIDHALIEKARGNREKARATMRDFTRGHNDIEYTAWTRRLRDYFLGILTEQELVFNAEGPCQQTEAYYYAGMDRMFNGELFLARDYFNRVLDLKVYGFREYVGADYALKSLAVPAPR
jgi:pentatricopeptide repeat protein